MLPSTSTAPLQLGSNIAEIAAIIRKDWANVYFGAIPYLNAMSVLPSVDATFGQDSARSIVQYFLGNARTWRGPVAKQVKAHLNQLLENG